MRVLLQKYSLHDNDESRVEKVALKSGDETLSTPHRGGDGVKARPRLSITVGKIRNALKCHCEEVTVFYSKLKLET